MKTSFLVRIGLVVVCGTLFTACNLPAKTTATTPTSSVPVIVPTATQNATQTPVGAATATQMPPPPPPATPTILYTVALTLSPTPTELPGVLVRIWNKSLVDVNLYRHGLSGEIHFLGWLSPNYYGEYRFPDLGRWRIRYCERDIEGESFGCEEKFINVGESGQAFDVP